LSDDGVEQVEVCRVKELNRLKFVGENVKKFKVHGVIVLKRLKFVI